MANEKNLITPQELNARTTPEQKSEYGRKAGIASGKARRERKQMHELVNMALSNKLDGEKAKRVQQLMGVDEDDATLAAAVVAGQIKAAIKGSTKAFETLSKLDAVAINEEGRERGYMLSPLRFTSDFVEPYRVARAALAGENGIREIISKGGRGSIKSNFWAGFAFETIKRDPEANAVFTRRYKTDLRYSVYSQFEKTVLREDDLDNWGFTTSPMEATYLPTGQKVLFVGCDKPISLKSFNIPKGHVKLLIHEEADEMAGVEQMDNVEDTFLRSDTPALDIKIFNPPKSANNFMNEYAAEKAGDPATYVCHSCYENVPREWLGERFFERAEWFRLHKPEYYRNNYEGAVTGTGGELFGNVEQREITDEEIARFGNVFQGLDFGFEHPMSFVRTAYDFEADTLYVFFEHVQRRAKLSAFCAEIEQYRDEETICDSAEPDRIADMADWGWRAVGAVKRWKGGHGRAYAWDWLRSVSKIVVDPARCPNAAKEFRTLEFEQLRDGTFSSRYPDTGEDGIMSIIYSLNRVIMEASAYEGYGDE